MLEEIRTGGQDGGDFAAWCAARAAGIRCAGTMPLGFRTASGDRPEYAAEFGAVENESREWPPRTEANVRDAAATLVFNAGPDWSPGTKLAVGVCRRLRKPYDVLDTRRLPLPIALAGRIASGGYLSLNIGGNRAPHPWPELESYLTRVFALLLITGHAKRTGPAPAASALVKELVLRLGETAK